MALLQNVAIDIEPATGIANKATALVQSGRRGAANTEACYEFYFGSRVAGERRLDEFEAQPPLLPVE